MNKELYQRRRAAFLERMTAQFDGATGVAILRSAPVMHKTADMDHEYRPDSDFYYLTGFAEPGAVAVLTPHAEPSYRLFVRPRDPEQEVWVGKRAGVEGAVSEYGADEAHSVEDVERWLPDLLEGAQVLYYALGKDEAFNQLVLDTLNAFRTKQRKGVYGPDALVDPSTLLHELRLHKAPDEIAMMRRAAEIAAEAHRQAMKACRPGLHEYELEAEIEYVFRKRGAIGPAYETIVGGGANGTILHYNSNQEVLRDGDLVLIDAGAEYGYYASDVTRTFPVNGRFTPPQRELYELVLRAQLEALALCRPGTGFRDPHNRAVEVLTEGMVELGWLSGDVAELVANEAYKAFYMHGTSHWLGMDVHDVGRYKRDEEWRPLEPGMVLTIEPGIYVAPGTASVDERYRGIGIRIEDDVLITDDGCEVLTSSVPKAVAEIEALMSEGRTLATR